MGEHGGNAPPLWARGLEGRTALVTGAGRGLGRACALALSEAGAGVIAVARTGSELDRLAEEAGGPVEAWVEDVTGDALLERIEALERIDVLVNNAGTNRPEPFLEVTDDTLDMMLNLNVRAAFRVARAAARVMMKGGNGGSIVHMSSQMGHVGSPRRTVYCMTKHGIEGLTRAMAVELAPHGIRVNAVAPTFVDTPLARSLSPGSGVRRVRHGHDPDEAARASGGGGGGGALSGLSRLGDRDRDEPAGRRRLDGAIAGAPHRPAPHGTSPAPASARRGRPLRWTLRRCVAGHLIKGGS